MATSARDTPMMRQYLAVKAQYPDAIVCYRMGDFYELFLEDAERVAPILDITLTSRDKGKPDAVPMCGFPVHAADGHIKRLAELGHRVAICEQVEDPKVAGGKRLVRREVVEVVTPGLVGDPAGLDATREVALVALFAGADACGLAALDASTGDFRATAVASEGDVPAAVLDELRRIAPREVLVARKALAALQLALADRMPDAVWTGIDEHRFDPTAAPVTPEGFDANAAGADVRAAAAILSYLGENQPFALEFAPRLRSYVLRETMLLDDATRTHLELFANTEDGGRRGALIERIDETVTPLGARRLGRWLAYPLLDPAAIRARQEGVAYLAERDRPRSRLREALREVRDLERILAKAMRPTAVPRDLGVLRSSLLALPEVAAALADPDATGLVAEPAPPGLALPEPLPELAVLLCDGLVEDPPVVARGSRGALETGYVLTGFRPELDALREAASKGREWIAGLEAAQRERTGISTLKIRYHPVHGYSLEVSKSRLAQVPDDYERKQTLANVERFTTAELREVESRVMGANERAAALEREIFESLRQEVVAAADAIRAAADHVAELDAHAALAELSRREGWVRPEVTDDERIVIEAGRHPVVEVMPGGGGRDGFVPNDTFLATDDAQILLLTGPNMSGKSTYLRQVALIVLLAQMGSYVPATSARIGVVDRIFTRVGASDRLARGESTFMVEMRETAEILSHASSRSLVILDEIGRGTSTFDGLSIAWAVAEYLHDTPGVCPRTLFATHYHELTDLALTKARVRNGHFEAKEWRDEVVFLRRLVPGGANRSYGIQVARLAGLPAAVIERARQILANLEGGELDGEGQPNLARSTGAPVNEGQLALFAGSGPSTGERAVLEDLRTIDPEATTPMEALIALQRWHERLVDEEPS